MDRVILASALVAAVRAQQACSLTAETHPSLTWQTCSDSGCTDVSGSIVLDGNWRWTHEVDSSTNCYTGNEWDTSICPDGETCAEACCLDGADYEGTYGITASGSELSLTFVTEGEYSTNIGSRVYLMADDDNYEMFSLIGNEFTFDVDVSNLGCGLNGALYFVSMDEDGGLSAYDGNNAGAAYGTGYCDSQCPRDIKFIGGVANVEDWTPSSNDENAGVGNLGACCSEMDVWEANSISNAFTPHPCSTLGFHTCEGDNCGGTYSSERYAGDCDPDGCDFNPYRQGNTSFYGPGMTIDSNSVMTVVTQFVGSGTTLSEIKRYYVQNGVVIANADSVIPDTGNSITDEFCTAQKEAFGDTDVFGETGGLAQMGADMQNMVLVMSLWDDHYANMLWLDSTYPVDSTSDGAERGTCSTDSGVPADVESEQADATVVFSNIKFGPIGTTFDAPADVSDGNSGDATSQASAATASSPTANTDQSTPVVDTTTSTTLANTNTVETSPTINAGQSTPVANTTTSITPTNTNTVETSPTPSTPTTKQTTTSTTAPATATSPSGGSGGGSSGQALYMQCGGINWTGSTTCSEGCCKEWNPYYSQCVECDSEAGSSSSSSSSSGSSENGSDNGSNSSSLGSPRASSSDVNFGNSKPTTTATTAAEHGATSAAADLDDDDDEGVAEECVIVTVQCS